MNRYQILALLAVAAVLLGACSSMPSRVQTEQPEYVMTVRVGAHETVQSLERRFGGSVLVLEPGRYAVLSVKPDPRGGVSTASSHVEPNHSRFLAGGQIAWMNGQSNLWAGGQSNLWAGGQSNLWAGGQSNLWAGGQSNLWAGGSFAWMPQNTQIWQHIGLPQAHSLARNLGSGVKVAVIDTGVDLDHPALRDALAPKSEHWDFVDNDPVPQEQGTFGLGGYGHGTNVAGIIRQIAPRATILPLRVLGPDGRGDVVHLAAAINRAVANGANVINLSLGSENPSPAVEAALEAATAAGVMVVASAGNAGNTQVTYPASSARGADGWQRLSVTSINLSDARSFFASYGESIEVAAPGEAIYGPAPENQMAAWSGTSMAAPIAAGALALALGETLVVPMKNLADELMVRGSDLYNNDLNERYKDLLGDGRINLEEFLVNTILR